jgi:hypothetical protein
VLAVLLAVTAGGPVSPVVAAAHSPSAASRATPVGAPAAVSLQAMHGLLVSDSVGLTLGPGFDRVADPREFVMVNASALGCGVLRGEAFIEGAWHRNAPKCDDWPQRWRDELGQFRPQLVVSLWGAWDMYDWRVGGRVLRFGTPEADEFVLGELDDAVGVLTSQGARLVALTSPYYEPLNAVNRPAEWRSRYDEPRVDHWNALLGQLAARHPGTMVLLDLHAFLSPGGKFTNSIGGVDDVRGDGVHFTPAGADLVARWLTPRVLRIARSTGVTPPATTNASIGRQSAAG